MRGRAWRARCEETGLRRVCASALRVDGPTVRHPA